MKSPERPPPLDLAGAKILIVEDHEDSRHILGRIVEALGASVVLAADGEEGLRLAVADPPNLVFCDLIMAGVGGFEFIRQLHAKPELSRIPVVAVSALGSDDDVKRTWAAGFSGHLVKPIDYDIIEAQLRRVFIQSTVLATSQPGASTVPDVEVAAVAAANVPKDLSLFTPPEHVPSSGPAPEASSEPRDLV